MDADGSKQQRLTRTRARDFTPSWSPDGTRIAFERRQGRWDRVNPRCKLCGGRATIFEVHVMNADGSRQRLLTREQSKLGVARSDAQPKWSPDGRRIAFVSKRDGNDEVYVVNADGSGLRNSTRNSRGDEGSFAWSPGQP
jgi:Tol biopolymer transport system component